MKATYILEDDHGRRLATGYVTDATPRTADQAYDLATRLGDMVERRLLDQVERSSRAPARDTAAGFGR